MEDKERQNNNDFINFEARQNLLGLFELLLKIDKRVNPDNYKNEENDDRHDHTRA